MRAGLTRMFCLVPDVLDVTHFAPLERYIYVHCWWEGARRLVGKRQDTVVGVLSACKSGRRLIT